jgi:NADH:ubiquinone oxidoreductase subunit
MWLHRMNDAAPTRVDLPRKHFETAFTENLTASAQAYVPYSTTVPKLQAWRARVAKRA